MTFTTPTDPVDSIDILSFEAFAKKYPLYGCTICSTFHIVRDVIIKQEVEEIRVFDGHVSGLCGYMVSCVTKESRRKRILLPWAADAEIDLLW